MATTLTHISGFIDDVLHQAEWRAEKAAQYPADERNQRSVDALNGLAVWLKTQPEDAPTLIRLNAALGRLYAAADADPAMFNGPLMTGMTDHLGRYGFAGSAESPESFLLGLVMEIEEHLAPAPPVKTETAITEAAETYVYRIREILEDHLSEVAEEFNANLEREEYEDEEGELDEDQIKEDRDAAVQEAREEFYAMVRNAEADAWRGVRP